MLMPRLHVGDWWNEMGRMQGELSRLFGRFNGLPRVLPSSGPATNVWEDEHHVYAEVELPGVDANKVELTVTEGDQLTIQGERKFEPPAGTVWHRQERPLGQFARQIALPSQVDAEKVEAHYRNGLLQIAMPKAAAAKPRKIEVRHS